MKRNNADLSRRARVYAFLLLKYRQRSEKEISLRLKNKKFPETIIRETVLFLKQRDFIDDKLFAKNLIESRLMKGLGLRRIRQELQIKGIDRGIIDSALEKIMPDYFEKEIVCQAAKKRLSRYKDLDPQKAKSRAYAYLIRRGFSPETVLDELR